MDKEHLQLHFLIFLSSFIPSVAILISIPAVELVFFRTFIAMLILGVILFVKKLRPDIGLKNIGFLFLTGILTAVYWSLLMVSAKVANASVTLIGLATSPLWVSFLQPLLQGTKVGFYKVVTGLNAIFGVYMIFSSDFDYEWGMALAISAAFFGALVTVLNSSLAKNHNHLVVTFYQMLGAFIGTACFLPLYGKFLTAGGLNLSPNLLDIGLIVALAFVFSVYAYSVLIKIMKSISPFTVALATNLSPIYGILIALAVFGRSELMNIYFYAGSIIIIASVTASPLADWLFKDRKPKAGIIAPEQMTPQ